MARFGPDLLRHKTQCSWRSRSRNRGPDRRYILNPTDDSLSCRSTDSHLPRFFNLRSLNRPCLIHPDFSLSALHSCQSWGATSDRIPTARVTDRTALIKPTWSLTVIRPFVAPPTRNRLGRLWRATGEFTPEMPVDANRVREHRTFKDHNKM